MKCCEITNCNGTEASGGYCVAHMPLEDLFKLLEQSPRTEIVDGRRTSIDGTRVQHLLEAGRDVDLGGAVITGDVYLLDRTVPSVRMETAVVDGDLYMADVRITGDTCLSNAVFHRTVSFSGVRFDGRADFVQAKFGGRADFQSARFLADAGANFDSATFSGDAQFGCAHVKSTASFDGVVFQHGADFGGITLAGDENHGGRPSDASFDAARFGGRAAFTNATLGRYFSAHDCIFEGPFAGDGATFEFASFKGADFHESVWLNGSRFDQLTAESARFRMPGAMGDLVAKGGVRFTGAVAEAPFEVRIDAPFVALNNVTLLRGGRIGVRVSRGSGEPPSVVLDGLSSDAPSAIIAVPRLDSPAERHGADVAVERSRELGTRRDELGRQVDALQDHMAGRDPRTSSVRNDRAAAGLEEDRARVLELQGRVSQLRASPKIPAEITDRLDEMASVLEWFRARAEQESNKSDGVRLDELRRGRDALALESERAELDAAQALLDVLADEVQATPVLGEDVRLAARTIEGARPQVLALEDVDVAMVTLDGLDMSRCRFAGTPNLDKARIDGTFPRSPATLRWSKRLVIAEERAWRVKRGHNAWRRPESGPPGDAEPFYTHGNVPPDASQLAEIYRALRKGREDAKDEPGAADFYYGEMEMRRHSRGRTQTRSGDFGERTVLWLYWLVSGYGLRASRALAALALTILVFALALWGFGLKNSDFSSALLQSIQGAAFRGGDKDVLTEAGQYIQIPLRLLGPLFFGLALLSLRGRVKR